MYCTNCGARQQDGAKFCEHCGTPLTAPSQAYRQPNAHTDQATYQQPYQQTYQSPYQQPAAAELSMKWFKFLIYFSLWAGAVINLANAVLMLTGSVYEVAVNSISPDVVYGFYGNGLKAFDMIYGIAMLALAAFSIHARFRLAKFRKDGPLCLYIVYGASIALSLIYTIGTTIIVGESTFSSDIASNVLVSFIFIFVNRSYFKKRSAMFVN